MISVLIPVFNTDVVALVTSLSQQMTSLRMHGEILVVDDASSEAFRSVNRQLNTLPGVRYEELSHNIGRLQIRRELAAKALHPWLVFIDGDSRIINELFLKNYLEYTEKDFDVLIGGRLYQSQKPENCSGMLHWKYGKQRENIVQRKKGFLSNNFCIRKKLFEKLKFAEGWEGYGHEDTWIGIQLIQAEAKIAYLNNPVLHDGIEEADTFLEKSDKALQNLLLLSKYVDKDHLRNHVRLFDYFLKLKQAGMAGIIVGVYKIFRPSIEKNLQSCRPSLRLFDFYRLSRFILLSRSKN